MGTARLFAAVWPDEQASADLHLLHRKDQPGVRFVPAENWHVTLRFFGDADPVEAAAALGPVAAGLGPVEVHLGPVVELLSDHSVIVPADGLTEWAHTVGRATGGIGTEPPRRRFVGHVTLARLDRRVRRGRASLPGVVGVPVATGFVARDLTLVRSHLSSGGARYEVLESWSV